MPWREADPDLDGENAHLCGCWIWTGYTDPRGCPVVRTATSTTTARRAAYERENGPVPEGKILIAMCGEPLCVRVSHAEPVNWREWQHRCGVTKADRHLRRDAVRLKTSGWSVRRIARAFDVSPRIIGRVLAGDYFDPCRESDDPGPRVNDESSARST